MQGFETEDSLEEDALDIVCDEQEIPIEEIFEVMEEGTYFGQLAFENSSYYRQASVYAKSSTHMLVIDDQAYLKMTNFNAKRHE